MAEIMLACQSGAWGGSEFVTALTDIAEVGYSGLEATPVVVPQFEDRVAVFHEMLSCARIKLAAVTSQVRALTPEALDEELEWNLNLARFLRAAGGMVLVLLPPRRDALSLDLKEAQKLFTKFLGELAHQTAELSVRLALHPERDTLCESERELLPALKSAPARELWLALDTGSMVAMGLTLVGALRKWKSRLGHVHLRDLRFTRKGRGRPETYRPVELGRGKLALDRFFSRLLDTRYEGWVSVELEGVSGGLLKDRAKRSHRYSVEALELVE